MAQSKILLVDDEIKTRQLFSRLLSNQGFIVQTASDGEKALIKANEFQPNCILLDVRMGALWDFPPQLGCNLRAV